MKFTDGMEKIKEYLTEGQIHAYEGLSESMDRLSLGVQDRLNVLREFLEKEGLIDIYMKHLTEEQRKQFLSVGSESSNPKQEVDKSEKLNEEKKEFVEKETYPKKVLRL